MKRVSDSPPPTNDPAAILAGWIALEALSPQTYRRPEDLVGGDRSCIVSISNSNALLPWERNEPARPNRRLYYQVVLGAVVMDRASEALMKAFGKDEEHPARVREKAALGVLLVDDKGIPIEENGIAVSSFGWALPLALSLKLEALGTWPHAEAMLSGDLHDLVHRVDEEGEPIPLDLSTILDAHRCLVEKFRLPRDLVEDPAFAIRIHHHANAKSSPEPMILNSFFLEDLSRANTLLGRDQLPISLRRYLGMERPTQTHDVLADRSVLESAAAPHMSPASRWPSPGGFPLVMLQQTAVNLARSELADGESIVAVNGPPGTGKTTLLRDLVAACILDRALAMSAFDNPDSAFTESRNKMAAGEKGYVRPYSLAPSLKGHEVLVASSNNKAVENVSRELPAVKAVGRTVGELNYFRSISDALQGSYGTHKTGDADAANGTWGLIAAVLGNARNRAAFQKTFWWHDDFGFRIYLKAAKGDSVVREVRDPETGRIIERRIPSVVSSEAPPSPHTAKRNWRTARERLLTLKREIDSDLESLEALRRLCLRLAEKRRRLAEWEAATNEELRKCTEAEARIAESAAKVVAAKELRARSIDALTAHRQLRPGFLTRLLRRAKWRAWSESHAPVIEATARAGAELQAAERVLAVAMEEMADLKRRARKCEEHAAALRPKTAEMSRDIELKRRALGALLVDDELFASGHEAANLASPWIPKAVQQKREDLFIASLAVHRAFIDAAAHKILHNLSLLMGGGAASSIAEDRGLASELWSTLFLVIPVLSTTFASVGRMLADLPPGSIGWLLVDEAGQALPQAAVGALLRTKRALMVGDPLQIPPVVTLPKHLTSEICRHLKIDGSTWGAPEASVQTLADRSSRFQSEFRGDSGPRRVGIPLLVHRRCQEPMFGISNRIAYDGQMVHASGPREPGVVGTVLGPSTWFDIDGDADSKWCPAEGELVASLLRRLSDAGVTAPDLFIIAPFRIVAQELRRRIERDPELRAGWKVDIRDWCAARVGTIHTVQGREAESVVLVLGAPKASQGGARNWAAGTPNILNVAVSRARQNLYVVGSHASWAGVGYARELAQIPFHRVNPNLSLRATRESELPDAQLHRSASVHCSD